MKPTPWFKRWLSKLDWFVYPGIQEIWDDAAEDSRHARERILQCPSGRCTSIFRCPSCPSTET